jgi:8-oxo-dGTP pyrophosphatase MutT (NUDIX family)
VRAAHSVESAGAAIFDDAGRVLLIKENYDRERWGFPGGAVEVGETIEQAVVREVREETGLDVRVDGRVGSYSLADSSLVCHLFRCTIQAGTAAVPERRDRGGTLVSAGRAAPTADESPSPRAAGGGRGKTDVEKRGLPRVS